MEICCALPARPAATRWQCSPAAEFLRDCFAAVLSRSPQAAPVGLLHAGSLASTEGFWRRGSFPVWYQSRGSGKPWVLGDGSCSIGRTAFWDARWQTSLPPPPLQLDHCLQEDFPIYKSFRFKGSIGPLRLHLVGAGAFARLRAAMGCPVPMPRVLREERLLAVIQGTVIS